jgi:uncharacterized membrane protein YkoI
MKTRTLLCLSLSALAAACASASTGGLHEESPGLLSQARVPLEAATSIALGWLPGATVEKTEIKEADGGLFYEFDLDVADEDVPLRVDARTGWVYTPATYIERQEYLEQVSVSDQKARQAALARVGPGRIFKGKLEPDSGMMMYTYEIMTGNGRVEVNVDGSTGMVYSVTPKG